MFHRTLTIFVAIALLSAEGCAGDRRGSLATTPPADHSDARKRHAAQLVESRPGPTRPLATACPNGQCDLADQQFTYKGRTIVVNEQVDPPKLTIDGKPIGVQVRLGDARRAYSAAFQSYWDFSSLTELAKALVDSGLLGPTTGQPAD